MVEKIGRKIPQNYFAIRGNPINTALIDDPSRNLEDIRRQHRDARKKLLRRVK